MASRTSIRDAIRRSAAATPAPSNAMARTLRLARQSGSLNLSSRDLQSFPDEVFRLYELLDEDERSWVGVRRAAQARSEVCMFMGAEKNPTVILTVADLLSFLTATMKFQSCRPKWRRSSTS
ncbi:hypothetical protein PF003_g24819 [Phytophthora fragariae]|nr:hypothetical protein PF003_g24819 [Phytophthora fragariae]